MMFSAKGFTHIYHRLPGL